MDSGRKRGPKPAGNKIRIFDTTLRDGEQCPGGSMNPDEKLQVARLLKRMNVDVIEAGFPIASPGEFQSVKTIAAKIKGPIIAGLARSLEKDIVSAAEALKPAGSKGRIHIFLATSKVHRDKKLKKTPQEILTQAVWAVKLAKSLVDDVEFSPEDAARTEWDFLSEVVQAVIDAGATTVNVPDTVGYAVPDEYGAMIRHLVENVPNVSDAIISVHCHNDLGLAVANSLAAVKAGARQVECTINGIGERAGNCSLEETVMAMKTRKDFYKDFQLNIDTTLFVPASNLVSRVTGMQVQRNKAIVGLNAFAHEAGIHQDGVMKDPSTYEIMTPESVGFKSNRMVIGKHSGRHAILQRVKELGYNSTKEEGEDIYRRVIELADKKKNVYDADIEAIVNEALGESSEVYVLDNLGVSTGKKIIPTATVTLIDPRGNRHTDAAIGDGPINAAYNAIDRITGITGKLKEFRIEAVTEERESLGEVTVRVDVDGEELRGRGMSTDIIEAATLAYLNAVCRSSALMNQLKNKTDGEKKNPKIKGV